MKFCERPFKFAYCAPDGEVWPCGWMHYVIGNLYEQNMDEIWHSEAAQKARETILDGSFAYCRKIACPFLERDELPDLSADELQQAAVATSTPEIFNIANDKICNIACTTCRQKIYQPNTRERQQIDGALERLLPFVEKAKEVWMNGQGEFLANPSFIHMLERLRLERDDFQIAFETLNCTPFVRQYAILNNKWGAVHIRYENGDLAIKKTMEDGTEYLTDMLS